MFSHARFFFAALFFAWSLLAVFPAPNLALWRFAIIATEYGHWLMFVPLLLIVFECFPVKSGLPSFTIGFAVLGAILFLTPAARAARVAETLPLQLEEAYGSTVVSPSPFSWRELWHFSPRPEIAVERLTFPTRDGSSQRIKFYHAARSAPRPCVIIVHGGGWTSGSENDLASLPFALAQRGYQVASISYRLAPGGVWPAQKEDTLAALDYLKKNAAPLGINPHRFIILGRSAGGQIALATAYAAHDPDIRGCIAFYAPTDMHFAYRYGGEDDILKSHGLVRQFMGGTPEQVPAQYDDASAWSLVDARTPPTLLLHGERDELVWFLHSTRLQRRLLTAQRPVFYLPLPWATHAFDLNLHGPGGQLSLYAVTYFLAKVAP